MKTPKLRQIGSAAAIYLGVAWGVLEASSFLLQKYRLEEGYQDILILVLIIAFPMVLVYNGMRYPFGKTAIGAYIVIASVGSYFILHSFQNFNQNRLGFSKSSDSRALQRIAIMPVINLTGQDSIDYLIHGIHESLTNEMGQLKLFDVISNRTTNQFKGMEASIMEINSKLDVDAIIETSVLGSGDSIRVEVRLTETESERQVWSGNFNYATKNILELYAQVSKSIAHQINKEFKSTKEQPPPSYNAEAIRAYYKGMEHWDKLTIDELMVSMRYFEQAVALDSTFPGGYVGNAIAWGGLAQMQQIPYKEVEENGIPQLDKALMLDSTNVHVLFTKATMYGWWLWDWDKGEQLFKKTLEINPSYSDAMSVYAHLLISLGRNNDALNQIKRALEIDPLNTRFIGYYAMILNFAQQYEKAEEVLVDSDGQYLETGLTESTLQTTYHMQKQYDKAIEMWLRMYTKKHDDEAVELIQTTYSQKGYSAALIALADLFIDRSKTNTTYVSAWGIATKLLRGGDYDRGLDWLTMAYEEHNVNMPYINTDPIFDPVRTDPRFKAIHSGMNFPE